MCTDRLIVLKFGGSVLQDESTLPLAVSEIYRWHRQGYSVLAVLSALAGRTDELLREGQQICADAAPESIAALAAIGELQSAAKLGLQLDRAGLPACVLTPQAIRLLAMGHPLDATPHSFDIDRTRRALSKHDVVVVPGYVAESIEGRTVLLGRGGSDLTALFLAYSLRARECRLIKDVDGLYDQDPAKPGAKPRRYVKATWEDALATDGTIVQPKAVEFARTHEFEFCLGRFNGNCPTHIGAKPTSFGMPETPRRLRVALLGFGTVGGGVYELLLRMPDLFEVSHIAVRDPFKRREPLVPQHLVTTDAANAAVGGVDIVVETMGGLQPALSAVQAAINAGTHVVTANKALIARMGPSLRERARLADRALRYSAAVGGNMPLLERLTSDEHGTVRSIRTVINGSTNYILERVIAGDTFEHAVAKAQELGFAEKDPSRDLSGLDAADKLSIIAQQLGYNSIQPEAIPRDSLTEESVRAALGNAPSGHRVRHVASFDLAGDVPHTSVRTAALSSDDALFDVPGERNAAAEEYVDGHQEVIRGRGAGRWPTAEAVVADLLDIALMERNAGVHLASTPAGRSAGENSDAA